MSRVWLLVLSMSGWSLFSYGDPAPSEHPTQSAEVTTDGTLAPLPEAVQLVPKKVQLGEKLFNDRRLSGDNSRACVDCHPLDKGAMDGKVRGIAIDGQPRLRNTLTLFNVAFNGLYNWDGRTSTLEEHGEKLLTNPSVMNANWPELLSRLKQDSQYSTLFSTAYADGLTHANIVDALSEFERSLVTPHSRFDRYLRSGRGLNSEEERGLQLFKAYGCVACHQGMNIGGNLLQRFGIFRDPNSLTAPIGQDDPGRFTVTGVERDRGVFRVPSLRNVAITAPYFHDGRVADLKIAVATMAQVQLGRELNPTDVQAIVRFLGTLTGEYKGQAFGSVKVGPP